MFGTKLSGAKDPATWLDYALEHPMCRVVLLQPDARQIAIGTAPMESTGGLGAVITTYAFFGAESHQANATRVMQRLAQERAARRLPPVATLGDMPALADEARLVNAGRREPMAALDKALAAESERFGRSMRGWALVRTTSTAAFPEGAPSPRSARVPRGGDALSSGELIVGLVPHPFGRSGADGSTGDLVSRGSFPASVT